MAEDRFDTDLIVNMDETTTNAEKTKKAPKVLYEPGIGMRRKRNIEMIVIPEGMTPYLQAGDAGIYRQFKDELSNQINESKNSNDVTYTRNGNPRLPSDATVVEWVRRS